MERKIHKTLDSFRVGGEVFSIALSDAEREIKATVARATDDDVIQFKANKDEITKSILSTVDSLSSSANDEFMSQFDAIKNTAITVADAADCEEARQAISKVRSGDIFGIVSALCIGQSSLIKELGEALSYYQP